MGGEDEEHGRDGSDAVGTLREWFLLAGGRFRVVGVVIGAVFVFFLVPDVSGYVPLENIQPLYYVYSGLISANLTLITVVVASGLLLLTSSTGASVSRPYLRFLIPSIVTVGLAPI
jgi:hypothetical protein